MEIKFNIRTDQLIDLLTKYNEVNESADITFSSDDVTFNEYVLGHVNEEVNNG